MDYLAHSKSMSVTWDWVGMESTSYNLIYNPIFGVKKANPCPILSPTQTPYFLSLLHPWDKLIPTLEVFNSNFTRRRHLLLIVFA